MSDGEVRMSLDLEESTRSPEPQTSDAKYGFVARVVMDPLSSKP